MAPIPCSMPSYFLLSRLFREYLSLAAIPPTCGSATRAVGHRFALLAISSDTAGNIRIQDPSNERWRIEPVRTVATSAHTLRGQSAIHPEESTNRVELGFQLRLSAAVAKSCDREL